MVRRPGFRGETMSDVVLIFAEADRESALAAAHALRVEGLRVYAAVASKAAPAQGRLSEEINRARCVVTLWSERAKANAHLIEWARAADQRKALVSASLDGSRAPTDFPSAEIAPADWSSARGPDKAQGLLRSVRDQVDKAPNLTREEFLSSFFFFGGLHFGLTLEDAVSRFGLPSESNDTMLAYEHGHAEGPGLVLVQTHDESKLINFVVVHGQGGIDFLNQHEVVDPRLAFIGMHKDEIFRILGAPSQNIGELEDGRICFGYNTIVGVEATAGDGQSARFGLVIYVLFYITSRDIPFCTAMSVQWDPVPFPEELSS
jgi:TIR domain